MPERLPDGARQRGIGDAMGPFFRVRFYNMTVEPTGVQLTDEELREIRQGGLVQPDAAITALTRLRTFGNLLATIGSITGVTIAAQAQARLNQVQEQFSTDYSIQRQIPQIAASMTATSESESPYRFTITLAPEYQDGVLILNSRLLNYATVCEVEWGYTTGGENLGPIITDRHIFRNIAPKVSFGENIQIIVEGVDISSSFAQHNHCRRKWSRSQYPTDYDIIKAILSPSRAYSFEPSTSEEARTLERFSPIRESGIFKRRKTDGTEDVPQRLPDMAFVRHLMRNSGNVTYAIVGTTFKFFSITDPDPTDQIAYTFRWRQQLQGSRDVPVYGATCNVENYYFQPLASRGLVSIGTDEEAGTSTARRVTTKDVPHHEPVSGATEEQRRLLGVLTGDETAPTGATTDGGPVAPVPAADGNVMRNPCGDVIAEAPRTADSIIDQRTLSILQESGNMAAPEVQFKCPGVPDLFPGQIVELVGFTDLFDSQYRVHKVKHTISSAGYDCDVTVMRYSYWLATATQTPNTRTHTKGADTDTRAEPGDGGPISRLDFTGGG